MKEMNLPNKVLDSELDEYAKKTMDDIRNDKEFYEIVKSLGDEKNPLTQRVVKENIGKLGDWFEDYQVCKNCPGYENCPKATRTQLSYAFENGMLVKQINFCEKEVNQIEYDSCFYFRDFPKEWSDASKDKINLDKERSAALKEYAKMYKNEKYLTYIKGSIGVGKSYLAAVIVNNYLVKTKRKNKVAFVNCSELFKTLADKDHSYKEEDKKYFKDVMNILSSVPFLVLDGFGNEIKSTFVRDVIILPLLSARKRNDALTLITSNYSVDDIVEMYSFGKRTHPSAKMIGDTINYLSDNTEVEIKTINLFK